MDQEIDQIVRKYQSDCRSDSAHCVDQIRKILAVLEYIETVDWDNDPPDVDFNVLLPNMRTWFYGWLLRLVTIYEQSRHNILVANPLNVHHPSADDFVLARLIQPEIDLTSHELEAFAMFRQEEWTGQFMMYLDEFFLSVQNLIAQVKQRTDAGDTWAHLNYTDLKFKYIQLLQHVFDVPSVDDRGDMAYRNIDDPSRMQMLLQEDENFINLLNIAGEYVLWLDDDFMDPSSHELPHLFHEMNQFYNDILDRLTESDREPTPETQPMQIERSIPQDTQMKSWLDRLYQLYLDIDQTKV